MSDTIKKLEHELAYSKDLVDIYTRPKKRIKHQTDFVEALTYISRSEKDTEKKRVWLSRVLVEQGKLDVTNMYKGLNSLDKFTLKAVNTCRDNISDCERKLLDLRRKTKSFNVTEIELLESSIKHSERILAAKLYDTKERVAEQVEHIKQEKEQLALAEMPFEKEQLNDRLVRSKQKLFDIKWAIFFGYIDEDTKHSIGIFEGRIKNDKYKLEKAKGRLLKLKQKETT